MTDYAGWASSIVLALGTFEKLQAHGGVTTRNGLNPARGEPLIINYKKNSTWRRVEVRVEDGVYAIFHFTLGLPTTDENGAPILDMNLDSFANVSTGGEVVAHLKKVLGL